MSKKSVFYIGFFAVLVFVFYFAIRASLVRKDTISVVRSFSFTNQSGQTFTNKDTEGKVYVAEFFFTNCEAICPKMNNNLRKVYDNLRDEKDFMILSFTCDPARDSVAQLKKYADSMAVNTNKWVFLTGRKDSLYNLARVSYTIDDPANNLRNINDDFLHTQFWALVDQKGEVKNIYDGLKESEVEKMIKQIKKLL
jgi:protein SCO1